MKKGADGFLPRRILACGIQAGYSAAKGGASSGRPPSPPLEWTGSRRSDDPAASGGGSAVLFLLLLGAIGAAAFQYRRDPVFHAQADRWYATASVWTRQKWSDLKVAATKLQEQPHAKPKTADQAPIVVLPAVTETSQGSPASQATQPAVKPSPWDQLYNQTSSTRALRRACAKTESQPSANTPSPSVSIEPPPAAGAGWGH